MATRKTIATKSPASKTAQAQRSRRAQPAAPALGLAKPARTAKGPAVAPPAKPVARSTQSAKPAALKKTTKLRKKPVRDSFTMPETDFALIATLKARALTAKREAKKSELLRAGLHALALLDAPALVAALSQLAPVKVGRPKSGH